MGDTQTTAVQPAAGEDRPFGWTHGPLPTCPRCKRPVTGWPASRADVCSPADWDKCIRQPEDVLAGMNDAQIAEYEAALRADKRERG